MKKTVNILTILLLVTTFIHCPKKDDGDDMTNLFLLLLLANAGNAGATCTIGSGISQTMVPDSNLSQSTISMKSAHALNLESSEFVPGEVLVKYKTLASASSVQNSLQSKGLSVAETIDLGAKKDEQIFLIKTATTKTAVAATIQNLNADPNVEYAQPNYIYHALETTPTDTSFSQLWGLNNTGQTVNGTTGTSGVDIDAPQAWDTISDCSSVIVAVLDSGINYNHEDLTDNMWDGSSCKSDTGAALNSCTSGYDYVDTDKIPMDTNGHGTHVAGTIGGSGNNGKGMTGVCWKVQLMAVRVLGTTGSGTTVNIVKGVNFAVQNGAKVINASLGGSSSDGAFITAITNARNAGVVFVAAAGNEAANNETTPSYPANYTHDNIISVAAVDQKGALASFSNYGATTVDIAAPGVNIYSSWPGTDTTINESAIAGWTTPGDWAVSSQTYGSTTLNMLTNHSNWYGTAYNNSINHTAYKVHNLSTANAVTFNFYLDINMNTGDMFNVVYNTAGASPSTVIQAYNGATSGGSLTSLSFEVASCAGQAACSLGFNMTTDATTGTPKIGAGVGYPSIKYLTHNTTSYNTIQGTSMAAPHVAGLAAMLFAKKPSATYSEVITAIYNGGLNNTALNGKMVYPKLINADCALRNLNQKISIGSRITLKNQFQKLESY